MHAYGPELNTLLMARLVSLGNGWMTVSDERLSDNEEALPRDVDLNSVHACYCLFGSSSGLVSGLVHPTCLISAFLSSFVLGVSSSQHPIMVHYLRFLRTPQAADISQKCINISAVAAVTTDLGDSFLSQDVTIVARIVDATKGGQMLCSSEVPWENGSRAAKITLPCNAQLAGRLAQVHLTTRDTISAHASREMPAIVDVWSSPFTIKPKLKTEPVVERRVPLKGKSQARIWEETGDSIARHIWFVVSQAITCFC
jgi:hypothetical protein